LKLDLTSTKINPLFGRKEILFLVDDPVTPPRSKVRIEIAVALRTELDHVYIRYMETKSGTHHTVGLAHVYDDPENAIKVEPKHIVKRNESASPEEPKEE
jgi:ribosomal protein S24E